MTIKRSKKVLNILQEIYTAEVGAVAIYIDQHVKCSNSGHNKFADKLNADAVEEMKHAERLAERILFLGGPIAYEKHEVPKSGSVEITDILKLDISLEKTAVSRLNDGIRACFEEGDNGSRLLLEEILKDEEAHMGNYEAMLENIAKYGDVFIVQHLM